MKSNKIPKPLGTQDKPCIPIPSRSPLPAHLTQAALNTGLLVIPNKKLPL